MADLDTPATVAGSATGALTAKEAKNNAMARKRDVVFIVVVVMLVAIMMKLCIECRYGSNSPWKGLVFL